MAEPSVCCLHTFTLFDLQHAPPTHLSPPSPPGLELAKQCGLRQQDVIEVVKLGAIASPMFALKAGEAWA